MKPLSIILAALLVPATAQEVSINIKTTADTC
jgi:hypothetical protein